jgi:hypothetical protein
MGCGGSRDDEASLNSRRLDVQIAKDARVLNNDTKMLLLGPGESGKSTLFKQMKILAREGGYSEAELVKYKANIYESSSYFFESLERFRDPMGYTPTAQDVLRARVRSTGIEEAEFKV